MIDVVDKDGKFIGEYVGGVLESICFRQEEKIIKICMGFRIPIAMIPKLNEIHYPKGSGRITEIKELRELTTNEKEKIKKFDYFHKKPDVKFGAERATHVFIADRIPNHVIWTQKNLVALLLLIETLIKNGFLIVDMNSPNLRQKDDTIYFIDTGDIRVWDRQTASRFLYWMVSIFALGLGIDSPLGTLKKIYNRYSETIHNGGCEDYISYRLVKSFFSEPIYRLIKEFTKAKKGKEEDLMLAIGKAIQYIRDGKFDKPNTPSKLDLLRSVFSDYQNAQVKDDMTIVPTHNTVPKWNIVQRAAKLLPKTFSFADLGANYGVYSFLLLQNFKSCNGLINNVNLGEIVACNFVTGIMGFSKRTKPLHSTWTGLTDPKDLVLCLSLVQHVAGPEIRTNEEFAKEISRMVKPNGILVLEIPTVNDFAGKNKGFTVNAFEKALTEFKTEFVERVAYGADSIDRYCLVTRKK